jgi:hypothetical protein
MLDGMSIADIIANCRSGNVIGSAAPFERHRTSDPQRAAVFNQINHLPVNPDFLDWF